MIESMPLWGSVSIVGLLLGVVVTVFIMKLRGDIASRKEVDQVQRIADTFEKAWEISESRNEKLVDAVNKLVVTGDTTLKILDELPTSIVGLLSTIDEEDKGRHAE